MTDFEVYFEVRKKKIMERHTTLFIVLYPYSLLRGRRPSFSHGKVFVFFFPPAHPRIFHRRKSPLILFRTNTLAKSDPLSFSRGQLFSQNQIPSHSLITSFFWHIWIPSHSPAPNFIIHKIHKIPSHSPILTFFTYLNRLSFSGTHFFCKIRSPLILWYLAFVAYLNLLSFSGTHFFLRNKIPSHSVMTSFFYVFESPVILRLPVFLTCLNPLSFSGT